MTQDGPAHLYTGWVLSRLVAGDGWFSSVFHATTYPLPNLLAQGILAALTPLFPGAAQILMTVTFAGVALAALGLRIAVRGTEGATAAIPFLLLISLGRLWLLGFWGFLLGATLFALTCALWWRRRDDLTGKTIAALALLLLAGWFAHLVSFGVTAFALIFLAAALPGPRGRRVARTALAILPTLPFAVWYAVVMAGRGTFAPNYLRLDEHSVTEWLQYLKSVKVLSIASHTYLPFVPGELDLFALAAPAVLGTIAFVIWSVQTKKNLRDEGKRAVAVPWAFLAALLLLAALLAPDSFGAAHGGFLRERLFLLGLMAASVAWSLPPSRATRTATAIATIALLVQSAFVWEYAIASTRATEPLRRAAATVPDGARVLVLEPRRETRFRARPEEHAAALVGVGRPVIVWNHYQSNLYFFPVNFDRPFARCSSDGACEIERDAGRIDVVIAWNESESREVLAAHGFRLERAAAGAARVYVRP